MRKIALTLFIISGFSAFLSGASWVVWPGESLQAAIDAAAPGDNITVQSGSYGESVTINKGLDIRAENGVAAITGNVTINSPVLPLYLSKIFFGSEGSSLTISGTNTDVRFDNCSFLEGGSISATDSKIYFYKCEFSGPAVFSNTKWTSQRSNFKHSLSSNDGSVGNLIGSEANLFSHSGGDLVIFQSTLRCTDDINHKMIINLTDGSSKLFLAYSTVLNGYNEITGSCEVVHNEFKTYTNIMEGGAERSCLSLINTGGFQVVRNNGFQQGRRYWTHADVSIKYAYWDFGGIFLKSGYGTTQIFNNTIRLFAKGIIVEESNLAVEIRNNAIQTMGPNTTGINRPSSDTTGYNGSCGIFSANQLAVISHNITSNILGGIQSENDLLTIPTVYGLPGERNYPDTGGIFSSTVRSYIKSNTWPYDYQFADHITAHIDSGFKHESHTDLDGSRNDIGILGGHSYDPTGRTTTKPVILSGAVDPLYVKRGGSVTIEARAAVVAEP